MDAGPSGLGGVPNPNTATVFGTSGPSSMHPTGAAEMGLSTESGMDVRWLSFMRDCGIKSLHAEGTSILSGPHTILLMDNLRSKNVHYGVMRPSSGNKTSKTKTKYDVAFKLAYDKEGIRLLRVSDTSTKSIAESFRRFKEVSSHYVMASTSP